MLDAGHTYQEKVLCDGFAEMRRRIINCDCSIVVVGCMECYKNIFCFYCNTLCTIHIITIISNKYNIYVFISRLAVAVAVVSSYYNSA